MLNWDQKANLVFYFLWKYISEQKVLKRNRKIDVFSNKKKMGILNLKRAFFKTKFFNQKPFDNISVNGEYIFAEIKDFPELEEIKSIMFSNKISYSELANVFGQEKVNEIFYFDERGFGIDFSNKEKIVFLVKLTENKMMTSNQLKCFVELDKDLEHHFNNGFKQRIVEFKQELNKFDELRKEKLAMEDAHRRQRQDEMVRQHAEAALNRQAEQHVDTRNMESPRGNTIQETIDNILRQRRGESSNAN